MAKYLLTCSYASGSQQTASLTRWFPIAGSCRTLWTVESRAAIPARASYTLSHLYVRVSANAQTSATTVTSRKNAGAGAQSVSIAAGATGAFEDTVNSDSLANGDTAGTQVATGTGAGITFTVFAYLLTCASDAPILVMGGSVSIAGGYSIYPDIAGDAYANQTQSYCQYRMRVGMTFSHFMVNVIGNDNTSDATYTVRNNGANVNETLSIPHGVTGLFEDATHTDVFASGDLLGVFDRLNASANV